MAHKRLVQEEEVPGEICRNQFVIKSPKGGVVRSTIATLDATERTEKFPMAYDTRDSVLSERRVWIRS